MPKRFAVAIMLLPAVVVILGGCDKPFLKPEQAAQPAGTLSPHQLAGRLRMRVDYCSRSLATISGPAGRITILGRPDPQVYVNGKALGQSDGILAAGNVLFVPLAMERHIRAALGQEPRQQRDEKPDQSKPLKAVVVIDAGHGGRDPGAIAMGTQEKSVNLAVSTMLADLLKRRGLTVIMTRTDDRFIELNNRAELANRSRADLFVSIHANSSPRSVCGYMIYVADSASTASAKAAMAIADRLSQAGVPPYGRQPHRAGFRVLVRSNCPAVLVEMGFLTHRVEAAKLARADYRNRIAGAIADGIMDYLGQL
ncbi:MAG TPA: N-acetylmuramoyl-L-alanine amidase [Phycisphaerae bacterium]|nr:N-acetylmuramoyl-L-alanine amidase [Phycisphaerae bacterium]